MRVNRLGKWIGRARQVGLGLCGVALATQVPLATIDM